jgi:hypothetical protein
MALDPFDSADPAPTISVRGAASIRTEPDEAVLWITLSSLGDAPGPALSDVSARSHALVALLDEAGVAKADRATSGVTVYEEFEHTEAGRRSLGHRAVSRVSVRAADPELIGRLIARTTTDLSARIDGPTWLVSLANPVRLEAARQAAADARRRAQAYAEGVGAKLGRVVRLGEPADGHVVRMAARASIHESIPVEPGEHEVAASIHATFELEPGAPE